MLGSSLLGMADLSADEITRTLDRAARMKSGDERERHLAGRCLGLLFAVPSTWTRVSFQVAASQLGADSYLYGIDELRLTNGETIEDTTGVLARYLDALVVRWYDMNDPGQDAGV